MASVAAGAIFLPELNSGLWRMSAREIRDAIPEHKRRAFYTQLISADCPEDEWAQRWASLVWRQGVLPLLDAAKDPRRIRWDMHYAVSVHLNAEIQIGARKLKMARIETRTDDERVLPDAPHGYLWISVAGDDASLLSEFNEDSCLSRELVCLPGLSTAAWAKEIRRHCQVTVRLGPRVVLFENEDIHTVESSTLKIVRWMVPISEAETDGTQLSCQIGMDFPTEMSESNFPALLASYYCAGKTVISFKLYHGNGPRPILRYYDEFLSEGSGNVAAWKPERKDTALAQSVAYRTPSDSLLWPGSGIYYWWEFPKQ